MERQPSSRARVAVAVLAGVAILGAIAWTLRGTTSDVDAGAPVLVAADRAPLRRETIDGTAWLVHPTLAFRVRDPGPAFVLDAPSAHDDPAATWLYRDPVSGHALSVLLDVVPHNTRAAFYSYVDGQKRGIHGQGAQLDEVSAHYFAGRGTCVIAARLGGERIVALTYVFETGRIRRAYRVGLGAPAELGDVVRSFTPPSR